MLPHGGHSPQAARPSHSSRAARRIAASSFPDPSGPVKRSDAGRVSEEIILSSVEKTLGCPFAARFAAAMMSMAFSPGMPCYLASQSPGSRAFFDFLISKCIVPPEPAAASPASAITLPFSTCEDCVTKIADAWAYRV